jgi:hypothetical protein
MANLIIEVPDDLARQVSPEPRAGSSAAILRVMQEPPCPSVADVDELDAAVAAGRLPIRTRSLFSD